MTRPRPVLILAALIAALSAVAGAGALLDFLPRPVVATILLINVAVAAGGGAIVQGAVTPLSAPQNANGTPLAPVSDLLGPVRAAARAGAHGGAREVASGVTLSE
jgi:hypothetical protein